MTTAWRQAVLRWFRRGLAPIAALAAWWCGVAAPATAQSQPVAEPARGPFPTVPAEHTHARALLASTLRYLDPTHRLFDPTSGYPFEGFNHDPARGMFLRSFTQITAIGLGLEAMANIAAGRAETPHLDRAAALDRLKLMVRTLRADQADPTLAAEGLLSNFLDLGTNRRLGPLASHVQKTKILETFGADRGAKLWQALVEAGWIAPSRDGHEADVTRKQEYGDLHFKGPLAPYNDEDTRRKVLAILDARVVMVIFGDNSNLTTSVAKTIGTLLDPAIRDQPGVAAIRDELEKFLEAQRPGYARLYDKDGGLFYFGWDVTRNRLFGWDDLQGKRVIGHMDYLVNEFRGPAVFVATRYNLPSDAVANLGFQLKPYRTKNGADRFTLAPWEGSAFQGLGLGLSLGEMGRPAWRELIGNLVDIEIDFSDVHHLPGFLSESYTGNGTEYTGGVGIPAITVSPRPRITDAATLYTLGAAYSAEPAKVEAFLARHWDKIEPLLTPHGPWEGYNVKQQAPIAFQTTAHTLALSLGLIGRGSADLRRYLDSKGLGAPLDGYFAPGAGVDLLRSAKAFGWTAEGSTLQSGSKPDGFHVGGDGLDRFGVAFVCPDAGGWDLSGNVLTLRYRSADAVDPISVEFKPIDPPAGLIPRKVVTRLAGDTTKTEHEIRVPLPTTPGLRRIKEVVLYHEQPNSRSKVDLTLTRFAIQPPAR